MDRRDYYVEYYEVLDRVLSDYVNQLREKREHWLKMGRHDVGVPLINLLFWQFTWHREEYDRLRKEGKSCGEALGSVKEILADKQVEEWERQEEEYKIYDHEWYEALAPYGGQLVIYIYNARQLVYLTPLIGGYIADKYWGIRRSVFWGAVMMAVGQFLMFMSASTLNNTELAHWLMYGGLGFLILGNGCFKPTVSSLVGQLYEPGDKRLDAAYTIFYMGVNVGSFAAPLICGYLGDTGDPHDFKWGFLAAGIMTLFTVVLFETQKNKYLFSPSGEAIGIIPDAKREKKEDKADHISHPKMDARTKIRNLIIITVLTAVLLAFFGYIFTGDWISVGIFTACIVFPVLILLDGSLTKIERSRIFVIYIVAFFVIFLSLIHI